jgi:hypothetical protein
LTDRTVEARQRLAHGNYTVPTLAELDAAEVTRRGRGALQLAEWGVPWPPPQGWLMRLREQAVRAYGDQDGVLVFTEGMQPDGTLIVRRFASREKAIAAGFW